MVTDAVSPEQLTRFSTSRHVFECCRCSINERDAGIAAEATRVRRFAEAQDQHIARYAEIFDGPRKRERVRRNDADVAAEIDEIFLVELLRVDHRGIDVR